MKSNFFFSQAIPLFQRITRSHSGKGDLDHMALVVGHSGENVLRDRSVTSVGILCLDLGVIIAVAVSAEGRRDQIRVIGDQLVDLLGRASAVSLCEVASGSFSVPLPHPVRQRQTQSMQSKKTFFRIMDYCL